MPRVPLVTCEELRPRSDIHARAFSEASRKGDIGDRWSAGESDSDRWMRMKGKTISRSTDRWTCTPSAPPPPVKAAEQRTPSVLSSVRWRTFEILLPISEEKINSWGVRFDSHLVEKIWKKKIVLIFF
jgi:hypothetical protein